MTQKKDTLALLLALGITAGIVWIGFRWFFPRNVESRNKT